MPDPNRNNVEDIIYRPSPADHIEVEAAQSIRLLRTSYTAWHNATGVPTSRELAEAQRGLADGVAKIVDAVIRLRAQKIGA